ncbi:hypothetical protein C8R47DRAFT_1290925 [Mycena vitilis]|nr:hypothetical protein C8R47DRAFT_1290925 [Mycena vitilis]
MGATRANKEIYFEKLKELLNEYPSIFLVNVDNVGSNQMHQIRVTLRGKGVYPQFERLLPHVKGNIGFVFTSGDLKEIREIIINNNVAASAHAGAPKDVTVPAGNTDCRGTIEIVADIKVVVAGTRVGTSEATMLNISPFPYGMSVRPVRFRTAATDHVAAGSCETAMQLLKHQLGIHIQHNPAENVMIIQFCLLLLTFTIPHMASHLLGLLSTNPPKNLALDLPKNSGQRCNGGANLVSSLEPIFGRFDQRFHIQLAHMLHTATGMDLIKAGNHAYLEIYERLLNGPHGFHDLPHQLHMGLLTEHRNLLSEYATVKLQLRKLRSAYLELQKSTMANWEEFEKQMADSELPIHCEVGATPGDIGEASK